MIISDDALEHVFSLMFGWGIREGSGIDAQVSYARLSDFHADLLVQLGHTRMLDYGKVLRHAG